MSYVSNNKRSTYRPKPQQNAGVKQQRRTNAPLRKKSCEKSTSFSQEVLKLNNRYNAYDTNNDSSNLQSTNCDKLNNPSENTKSPSDDSNKNLWNLSGSLNNGKKAQNSDTSAQGASKAKLSDVIKKTVDNIMGLKNGILSNAGNSFSQTKVGSLIGKLWTNFAENAKWAPNQLNYRINYFQQGSEGNCGLLSAIQAIGERPDSEEILRDMIKPCNGGYMVGFRGKSAGAKGSLKNRVFISKSDIARDSVHQRNKNSDLETSIINQAVKKVLGPPPYNPATTLKLLTGEKIIKVSKNQLSKLSPLQQNTCVGWWGNHAWSVRSPNELRNPHHTNKAEQMRRDNPVALYTTARRSLT